MKTLPNKLEKPLDDTKTVSIRLPRAIYVKLEKQANSQHRTISGQCRFILSKGVVHLEGEILQS